MNNKYNEDDDKEEFCAPCAMIPVGLAAAGATGSGGALTGNTLLIWISIILSTILSVVLGVKFFRWMNS